MTHGSSVYASVLIPVFARHLCLEHAIRSVLAQTVEDIELVLVGDGCTPEVADVARRWEARDQRVRFVPLKKGHGAGHAHRDRFVREQAAERVFYCDDDDIWLPNHVERFGQVLDAGADVADTPIVAATPSGHVDAGIHAMDIPEIRDLIGRDALKAIYDTHLAHTKTAYLKAVRPAPKHGSEHFPRMLADLAADPSITWQRVPGMTALSLVGKPRSTWDETTRGAEVAQWALRAQAERFAEETWQDAHRGAYLADIFTALTKSGYDVDNASDIARRSLSVAGEGASAERLAGANLVLKALGGRSLTEDEAWTAFDELEGSQPRESMRLDWVRGVVVPSVGWDALAARLAKKPPSPIRLCLIAEAEARREGCVSGATLGALADFPAHEQFAIRTQIARIHWDVLGNRDQARRWLCAARACPWPRGVGGEYHWLAKATGAKKLKPSRMQRLGHVLAAASRFQPIPRL